jgi:murein DD-endopeptidase MepM/ murein hydrolase activator NlpD
MRRFPVKKRGRRRLIALKPRNIKAIVVRQFFFCLVIVLAILIVKKVDNAVIKTSFNAIKTQFTQHSTVADMGSDAVAAANRLQKGTKTIVSSLFGSKGGPDFSSPADIAGVYSASQSDAALGKTLEFYTDKEIQVYAAAGGTVSEIGTDIEGNSYIKIYHGSDISSLYGGCTSTYVKALEKVKRGQIIASVAEGEEHVLRFEIWEKDRLANPSSFISFE